MSQILFSTLKKLEQIGREKKIPNISEQNAEYLKNLIRKRQPQHILEIGTANGYSTLQFASVFAEFEDSKILAFQDSNLLTLQHSITTIEAAWSAHIEAVEHFSNAKMKHIHAIW